MSTYKLPPEPEGPVWRWSPTAGAWLKHIKRHDRWIRDNVQGVQISKGWGELLDLGGTVTDQAPIEEELADLDKAVVSAANVWALSQSIKTENDLRQAVGLRHRKLHQMADEKEN